MNIVHRPSTSAGERQGITLCPVRAMSKLAEIQLCRTTHLHQHIPPRKCKALAQMRRHPEEEPVFIVNCCNDEPVVVHFEAGPNITVRRVALFEEHIERWHGMSNIVREGEASRIAYNAADNEIT